MKFYVEIISLYLSIESCIGQFKILGKIFLWNIWRAGSTPRFIKPIFRYLFRLVRYGLWEVTSIYF